ncbi:MAG: alpha/beta fold hydrolase [Planctomycetota bacterium]
MTAMIDEQKIELTGGAPVPLRTRWVRTGSPSTSCQVLGLHMLGLDADSFAAVADAMGPDVCWHAYDQRGHGGAADQPPDGFGAWVDDAVAAIRRIDADRLHLVGSSMGGAVAAEAAARTPAGRVASLAMIATPAEGRPVFAERARAQSDGTLERVIPPTLARWFGDDPPAAPADLSARSIRRMTPAGYDASWRALAEFRGFAPLADRLPPTLAVSFTDDLSTPPAELDRIAEAVRRAGRRCDRVDIPGTGHAGVLCKPAELADALRSHLQAAE